MEIENRNIAIAEFVEIAIKEINKIIENYRDPNSELSNSIRPLFGIRRIEEICQRVGGLPELMYMLRNAQLAPAAYLCVKELFPESPNLEGHTPTNWEKVLTIIGNFEADSPINLTTWRDIIRDVRALGPEPPSTSLLKR